MDKIFEFLVFHPELFKSERFPQSGTRPILVKADRPVVRSCSREDVSHDFTRTVDYVLQDQESIQVGSHQMLSISLVVPSIPAIFGFHIHKGALGLEIAENLLVLVQSSPSSLLFSKVGNEVEIPAHNPTASFRMVFGPVEEINDGLLLREATRAINIHQGALHPRNKVLEVIHEGKLISALV